MTSPLLVHGTGDALVAPHWAPLDLASTAAALQPWGMQPVRVAWRSPRPLSSAGLVELADGRTVFVKRHGTAVRTAAQLAEEHALAAHLRTHGVPVPEVLAAGAHGGWAWEVHAAAEGQDRYRDVASWGPVDVEDARAAGAALARLSRAAASHDAPPRRPALLVQGWDVVRAAGPVEGVRAFAAARPAVTEALARRRWEDDAEAALGPLQDALRPHLPRLPDGWTHGDGSPSNLLWRGREVAAVLDLGLADRTTPLLDLATALERSAVGWLEDPVRARPDVSDALLAGWASVLGEPDRAALAALLPVVHVDFALSEVGYYGAVVHDARDERAAWDYLLGHARWWQGDDGRALLDLVRGTPAAPARPPGAPGR